MNEHLRNHIIRLLSRNVRLDGRKLDDYRDIKVEYGVAGSAEGSARVTIGDTVVMAGIKLEVSKPYPDTPDKGALMVGEEMLPLSSPEFESGPPGMRAIEMGRVIDRGIREGHVIEVEKLCITPNEKCWTVIVDVVTINDSGNLFDASALAAMAALRDTYFPEYDGEKIIVKTKTDKKLPLSGDVTSCTVLKIGDHILVDPSVEEEQVYDARLTIAFTDDGKICAMQKGGDFGLSAEDMAAMVDLAKDKVTMLKKALQVK